MGWLCLMTGCLFFAPTALAMQGTYLARSIRHVKLGMGLLWGLHAFRMMDQYLLWQSFLSPDEGMGVWWQTLAGQTMAWQMLCVSLAWVWSLRWKPVGNLRHGLMLVALSMTMGGYAMAGHGAWASETSWQSAAAVVHVMLAQAWLAGVLGLLWLWSQENPDAYEAQRRLSLFSVLALPGMLCLLFSGGMVSLWSVGSWPALFVTPYGAVLWVKLCLVGASLWCAWRLRVWLHAVQSQLSTAKRWLQWEALGALGVLFMAINLAATVPAAHEALDWPLPFRWAPVLAWRQNPSLTSWGLVAWVTFWVLGLVAWLAWRHSHGQRARWSLASGLIAGLSVGLPATSIEAYPTTYMHSPVRLDVPSIKAGQNLYDLHCVACHGKHAQGNGPLAKTGSVQPANLTEPHVSWHTHGDMFWWLSHGKGAMPGFAQSLSEDERWHLINWLIALSLGYEARSLGTQPAPFNPWLPSIDFRFQMDERNHMSLSEWRGVHAVHLIIVNAASELPRVRELLSQMKGFPAQMVVVSRPEWLKDLVKGPCEAVLVPDTQGDIALAWSLYRRSFVSPDFQNEEPQVPRLEFLIDRYGFVRARWRSDEDPPMDLAALMSLYKQLENEGPIRSAAIHQHD